MPGILNIETSTSVCSVALTNDGMVIFNQADYDGPSHASVLGGFVNEAVDMARIKDIPIDAVAVSCGPGSYTGLRIGVSEAKGLCFGWEKPLIAVSTLELMVCHVMFSKMLPENALFCPMIDARRMEVYSAIYNLALEPLKPVSADVIDETSYKEFLDTHIVYFFGNGADKCKEKITHSNARFIDGVVPLAADMTALSERAFRQKKFEDVAYFEPFYLKEFVATTPKNKLF
ncbi:MAG: tRNA (adenosine(37)-N6)-threonylcarbamoyltransferase complex dimerization subunit type 1 TsaB [Bacteroidaceae bacterium]|nr:tRNA (adenosine(37)-N6)-threonylcarbamoyltransferase complex dimerization subunit type 1 TsaB [Bacteroidaceae bacterium]